MAIEIGKTNVYMDKPLPVGEAILDITLMYVFWQPIKYQNKKYQNKIKLCYMNTDSFIFYVETEDFYKNIANGVNEWFDNSGYRNQEKWSLAIGINKKVIGKFKDELNGDTMNEFIALTTKNYALKWINDKGGHISEQKKARGTKKCVIKKNLNFDLYKKALFNNETIRCT